MSKAAMLWSGGKDSVLALYEARLAGHHVCRLVTFAPPDARFRAHPLGVMRLQAQAMRLPHDVLAVCEPYEAGYEEALRGLRDSAGIDCVITGDIAEVDDMPNWIAERTEAVSLRAHMPLWGRDRDELLQRLIGAGFTTIISCVDTRRLDTRWVGRTLDDAAVAELRHIRSRNGLDLCGENGEYHTLVVDGPLFERRIEIDAGTIRTDGVLAYLDPQIPCRLGAAA